MQRAPGQSTPRAAGGAPPRRSLRAQALSPGGRRLGGYLVAVLGPAALLPIRFWSPDLAHHAFLLGLIPVILAAWFGGTGPAVLATGLTGVVTAYYVLPPIEALWIGHLLPLALFLAESAIVITVIASLRRSRDALRTTEDQLHRSERTALQALDGLLEGCQVIGPDWTYLYVNDVVAEQGRRARADLVGRTMSECYPGIEETPMFAMLRRCMADRTHHEMENRFAFPDGSSGWFDLRFVPVPDGVAIFSMDTTELRRTRATERRATEDLRLLVDGVRDYAIYLLDPEGRVATWNSGAERIKGYSEREAVGEHMRRFYPPEDVAAGTPEKHLQRALAEGRVESEGWRVRKDGTRFWASMIMTALRDADGKHVGFAKVIRDLTERRRLEEQFRQAQKMEAVGRLAGGVAHDFNNVLSVILSYSDMLLGEDGPGEPARGDIREIQTAGKRAADLTRQLLLFSRQQVVAPRVIDLNAILGGMERMLRRLLGEDVEMVSKPGASVAKVLADPGLVEQVMMNLVVNARDAMPTGGKLLVETATVELDEEYAREHLGVKPGPYVMLAVTDTGCGMDRATQERMFEPFFTTKEHGKGTGLGLSTVFGIVQQFGGSIWVYSEVGKGTTFKVYLPAVTSALDPARPTLSPRTLRGSETIFLMEDEEQVRAVARSILTRQGYRVLEARTPAEALLAFEAHAGDVDLLLTDVVMPQMSGPELAKQLSARRPTMRVLFMSGYTDDAVVRHGVLEGETPFIQKPFTPETLARKVRDVLDAGRR